MCGRRFRRHADVRYNSRAIAALLLSIRKNINSLNTYSAVGHDRINNVMRTRRYVTSRNGPEVARSGVVIVQSIGFKLLTLQI